MRKSWLAAALVLSLAGCQTAAPLVPGAPGERGAGEPTAALPAAVSIPTATLPAPTPLSGAQAAPTTLADAIATRMATSNPNPACPDHYPWFFANPADECASYVLNTWAVLQPFERGLMVWFQEGGPTYVLIDDGSPFKPYRLVSDPSAAELPGPDPNLIPPTGLYQPELGFAKFWRGLAPGSEWVRERLGWALAPEVAYSSFWQCNTAAPFSPAASASASADDAARCYFSGPRDEIIVMARGGAQYWNYWQRPVR
jgi:hypothetical protein